MEDSGEDDGGCVMGIGEKLKQRRLELNLSRNELAERVKVTGSAIANYENNISYPKPDILVSLMNALGIDANYLYRDVLNLNVSERLIEGLLPADEQRALTHYRALDEAGKKLVRLVIEEEYQRVKQEEWVTFPCYLPAIRRLNQGFLFGDATKEVKIKKSDILENTDFCFLIKLNRYEPFFKKEDVIAIQDRWALHNEMGIFRLNGIMYLKILYKVGEDVRLKALNVMEPEIIVTKEDVFECLGTVIGKVYGEYLLLDADY